MRFVENFVRAQLDILKMRLNRAKFVLGMPKRIWFRSGFPAASVRSLDE